MDATLTYKCPNCDAGLVFDAEKQKFVCDFCISSFTEAELADTDAAAKAEEADRANSEFAEEIDQYYCPSCGAEVIADKSTVSDTCYYCHNPIVLSDKVSGVLKPAKIIPFKFSKEEAQSQFLRFAKKKKFVPRDYFDTAQMEKIGGVYYPFWVTDADTDSAMNAIGKNVRTWRSGDYKYTETTTYSVYRQGRIHFEDITTSAISTEDKEMLEGILPFPSDAYVDFSMPYLQGFVAKKRDIDTEQISAEVKSRIDGYSQTLLKRTTNYDSIDVKSLNVAVLSSHWLYSLMPVWILTYKKKHRKDEKTYTYAMNGNTGKVYGELPISIPKLLLLAFAVLLGSFALTAALAVAFFEAELAVGAVIASVISVLAASITSFAIVKRYKNKLQGAIYPLDQYTNLSLTGREDRFLHRNVVKVRVNNSNNKR